ncbi:chemotaxis protein CheB [Planctomyces sp. SH-PL62]|uniref:chemotaxis protein CheB n=1 Tax=Planctomyces sp. SH-PL62 TaxID=1636152 RepID=UPI00078D4813|nr:chemotaxis protein CheB [Planctomyces sp. SH-PL62]AMV39527.1 Chemotaxis response regulator protein-glutamate methylesterase [Planctomyces sp. SH-PL62]
MSNPRAEAVAVGTSAGALEALSVILPALPENYPLPVLVVVHLPPDRESLMLDLLRRRCRIAVKEAEDKEPITGGTVYLAPPDYHLLVETDRRLSLSSEEPVRYSRPSIDVLFETAAEAYGPGLVGVVLTGANGDGSRGLRAICEAGGRALVQEPGLALASAMPQAALDACPEARRLSLEAIAERLLGIVDPT